ncbi:STAS/SEC14 domain-containing protein [Chloroflexales bacterium ZM16-3]|nr:STAS/SEC14 domain-containing protein [Chloroflexales bacterium ZM16-3]
MSTIPIEVSPEQLLRAVERLPADELASFAARVNALRARREAPQLSRDETALLLQINAALPPDLQARLDTLVSQREAEVIGADELAELTRLNDQIERQDALRLEALRDLAHLRQMTVPDLMDALGIPPHSHA